MKRSDLAQLLAVFGLSLVFAWLLLAQRGGQLDPDTWYHFLMSRQLAQGQLWVDISWLPYTVLGAAGPDHHWLWHLLLAPLTRFSTPVFAIQLATSVAFALVPTTIAAFLMRSGVRYAGLWALLAVAAAVVVPGRLMMLRAQNLALLLVLASMAVLYLRKPLLSLLLGFVFMSSYHGALVLAPIAGVYLAACYFSRQTLDWRGPAWMAVGVMVALLMTPWPGQNISYLLFHTLYKTTTDIPGMAGTEWLQLAPLEVLQQAWPAHLLLLAAGWLGWSGWRRDKLSLLLMGVTLLFLGLFVGSWRFVEYYAPLAVITAAVIYTRHGKPVAPAALASMLLALLLLTGWQAGRLINSAPRFDVADYREVSQFLVEHAARGELVVNSHWPDFPMLLWPDGAFRFVAGLDASYLAFADQPRFALWWQLAAPNFPWPGDIALLVQETFDSRWLVVNRGHVLLLERLESSQHARKAAESKAVVLFEIIP